MKTIILCGGLGTRIRDVAADIPKPMINIGNFPILWHIMKGYAAHGHKDFVLCLGYKSTVIKDFFINYEMGRSDVTISLATRSIVTRSSRQDDENWNVTLAETGLNAMTGARVKRVQRYVASEPHFLLTYGDGVGNVDISALVRFHLSHGKAVTVTGVRPPGRFGELSIDGDHVVGFNEKPQVSEGRISGGFFVCSAKLFDYLDDQESLMLEVGPMQRLVQDRELMVFKHDGFWHPMDTSRDFQLLNELWANEKAPWKIW